MSETKDMEKVKKRIKELEQAIHRLDFVKRHLNQNSSEVKSQIHTSISRHLETLRNREVWLLGQVDTVLGGKEEVLHRQQARLNKALGVLHSGLTHATSCDDETAAKHLVHVLEELSTTELKAEETPYIAFRADHVTLRESILSYGRVDANGMPLLSAFADEDKPSASLPRHVEEYGDSDDHVFYKALQDGKSNSSSIRVTMPKLSSRVEDWLQRPILQLSTSADEVQLLQTPASETMGTPVSQTTCAIQDWLCQIKHNPDVEEEDDFEIVDHSGSSQRESPVDEEMKPLLLAEQAEFNDVFLHTSRDMRQWLLKGGSYKSGPLAEELRAFFKHIPHDTSMWLMTARRQLESLEELKQGGWFCHIPTETSSWLRRAHDRRTTAEQPEVPDMFAHISQDKRDWLKKKTTDVEEMEVGEETSFLKFEAMGKGKSLSTPSRTPAPLSSIPDLMKEYVSVTPQAREFWLQYPEGEAAAAVAKDGGPLSTLPGVQKYLSGNINNNAWLANPAAEEVGPQPSTDTGGFFSHIPSNQSHWLLDSKRGSSPSLSIDLKNIVKKDHREWLRSGSSTLTEKSTTIPASPLDGLCQSYSRMSTTDWLLGGKRQDSNCSSSDKSWTTCSSESSLSSISSLQSMTAPCQQIPPVDLAAWIYQKCL